MPAGSPVSSGPAGGGSALHAAGALHSSVNDCPLSNTPLRSPGARGRQVVEQGPTFLLGAPGAGGAAAMADQPDVMESGPLTAGQVGAAGGCLCASRSNRPCAPSLHRRSFDSGSVPDLNACPERAACPARLPGAHFPLLPHF